MSEEEIRYTEDLENKYEHYRFEADEGQKVLRVDKFIATRHPNASRNRIKTAAEAEQIHVNGKPVKCNYKVKGGDVVTLVLDYPKKVFKLIPEDIPLDIVYEDEHLLLVNKKAGMVVHPSYGHYRGTLMNALAHHLKGHPLFDTENPRPGLVHRIDKDTSGLLVIAKNEVALSKLAKQFADKTSTRKYLAIVWGNPEEEGTIEGHVGRNIRNRKIMDVFPDGELGKQATTHYKLIESLGYVSLVECQLETGRTHQIRVHFKYIKHPLFNDSEYGGDRILKGTTFTKYKQFVQNCFKVCPRQALHAKTLGFVHPATNEFMSFDSELPEDMSSLIEKWKEYTSSR